VEPCDILTYNDLDRTSGSQVHAEQAFIKRSGELVRRYTLLRAIRRLHVLIEI